MAGLLDFLNTDEGRLGLGLLAASGPRSDGMGAGGRIQQAFSGQEARKDAAMKRQFQQSQMDNYASEIEARKLAGIKDQRQQAMIGSLMGGSQGGASDQGGPSNQGGSAPGIMELARQYGIPEQAIQADIAFNGGKKISELLAKHGARDMQVTNGYAYDKNRTGAGFMPSLNTSANGQTSMTRIGQDGLPVVGSPQGALETYGAYKGMDAGIQSSNELVQVYNPATKQMEFKPKSSVLQNAQPPKGAGPYAAESGLRTLAQGDTGANPAALQREIKATQNDLLKPLDEPSKALLREHLADLQRQAADPRNAAPTASSVAAQPSRRDAAGAPVRTKGQDALDAAFAKDYAEFSAGGGSADITKQLEQLKVAAGAMTVDSEVSGPYAGRIPDSLRTLTDTGAKAINAKELVLESVQRNLRVVLGAQFTEKEGEKLMSRAFNPLLPPAENKRRVDRLITQIGNAAEAKADASRYFEANGTLAGWQGELPTFNDFNLEFGDKPKAAQTFDAKPPAHQFKGKTATGPDGKRYKSDGLIWKEVK